MEQVLTAILEYFCRNAIRSGCLVVLEALYSFRDFVATWQYRWHNG